MGRCWCWLSRFRKERKEALTSSSARGWEIAESCWITLQAYAYRTVHPIDNRFPQATTNPIWVHVDNQPVRSRQSAHYFVRWIDKLTRMAEEHPGWRSEKEKEHVLDQFQQAKAVYQARLTEASD